MNWWVSSAWNTHPMLLIAWVFWVIFSICLHELAHGVAAIKLGDNTPIYTGHMTWNPVVHMGRTALIMFALFGFTWGAMPVSPSRLQHRYGEAIVAFAGPLCNLVQFLLLMPMLIAWNRYAGGLDDTLQQNVAIFLRVGCVMNLMGFIFNLIPVPPLDGSRIVGDIYPRFNELWRSENGAIFGWCVFAALFLFGGRQVWAFVFATTTKIELFGSSLLSGG